MRIAKPPAVLYFDHNATSPLRPECLSAVTHALAVGKIPLRLIGGRFVSSLLTVRFAHHAARPPADSLLLPLSCLRQNLPQNVLRRPV